MARPTTYDQETLDALLRAAGQILADEGPAALTMRRLAAAVGATTSAIYSLLGGKREVVRAMYREGFQRLAARLAEVEDEDPVGRVRALAYAYRQAATDRPHLYQVMFACPVPEFTPTEEDTALGTATLMRLRDAVADALHTGAFHGDADTITTGLWAVVHGLTSLELGGSFDAEAGTHADQIWDTTITATLAGLCSRPTA